MERNYKPTVALIYGGRGCESDVSVRGAEQIMPLIDREKYKTLSVFIDKDGRWFCNGGEAALAFIEGVSGLVIRGEMNAVDCAIPLLHGDFGEDGVVQGALENAKIRYVGCGVTAGAVCADKALTKMVARALGIPTLPSITVTSESEALLAEKALGYPMFVKPCSLGSSVGAARAENRDELLSAARAALKLDRRVLIESYISHPRELECAYFGANCKEMFTNPGEIICRGDFYDYERKYFSAEDVSVLPEADIGADIKEKIKEYSALLIHTIGVRDLCRVDFFLKGEELYFNEINTMPGFTPDSLYPEMLKNAGIQPRELIGLLIEGALMRD